MNDRIFDLLYKAEQREIIEKLRQKEMLNGEISIKENDHPPFRRGLHRVWNLLISLSGRG